jgi:hypothetical protein
MAPTPLFARSMVVLFLGVSGALHATQSPPANPPDGLIGVWTLNVSKSRYVPGPGPLSETRTYTRGPHGVEGRIERRFRDGRSERIEYTAEYDREYPVVGTDAYDHILLKRVDAQTAEAVLSHAGKVYGVARRVLSPDGQSMTITLTREASAGPRIANVAVYEKVHP